MKLNLGCGLDYREGYVNVDIDPEVKTDYCCDAVNLRHRYGHDAFDEIYANHTLEHFPDLFEIVDEMARVSKNGAIWYVNVPMWSWGQNQGNPWHKINFSPETFRFFDKGPRGIHKRREQNYSLEEIEVTHNEREIKFKLRLRK